MRGTDLQDIARRHGIHRAVLLPPPDLGPALEHALEALREGRIPARYRWTEEKTRAAYAYQGRLRWARSVLAAAVSYHTGEPEPSDPGSGRIAPYTRRNNYQYLLDRLAGVMEELQRTAGRSVRHKLLSNYTALPEKPLFACSGLGAVGKNSVLISPGMGSRFVVGEALTDLEPGSSAAPAARRPDFAVCGECDACMRACPTGAIAESGKVDVNRCIQFLSENLVDIPPLVMAVWGSRLYGCSTCLDVCPHNQSLEPLGPRHRTGHVGAGMSLEEVLEMDDGRWCELFGENQIGRREPDALRRNALVACGSLRLEGLEDVLARYLSHPRPLLRSAAAWALGRLGG
jgi:epoxyqueuosine reductase